MSLYKFKISDKNGKVDEILIEGDSQADATRRLQRRGVLPLEFLGEGSLSAPASGLGFRQRFDIVDFTDRLVPLIEAEVPLERALGIVGEGMEDDFAERVVADLRRGLHEGRRLSDLIRDRGRLFPSLYASVIEAGEEAGALPQVMGELRRFLNDSREFRAFLITSSIYPLVILAVSVVVVTLLFGLIIPRFAEMIVNAGGQMRASTRALFAVSDWMRSFWWGLPLGAGLLLLGLRELREGGKLRARFDDIILSVPVAGRLVLLSNLARMARTMAILMRSGVHLLDTVSIAARVLGNATLGQSLAGLAGELRQGQRLSHALGHSRFIPAFLLRMVAVGEETGAVETMLDRVADRYEIELKRLTQRTVSLFEPAVIIFLGVLVGGTVMLMFLAIMDLQENI